MGGWTSQQLYAQPAEWVVEIVGLMNEEAEAIRKARGDDEPSQEM